MNYEAKWQKSQQLILSSPTWRVHCAITISQLPACRMRNLDSIDEGSEEAAKLPR